MEFARRAEGRPVSLGILSSAFHPPTRAHFALARAALDGGFIGEALFVLPRRFPHKDYGSVGLEDRLRMLDKAVAGDPRVSVGVSEGGLFLEIAREARQAYGPSTRLWFLCGSDAAERILNWDYGALPGIGEQLKEYGLLAAPRGGPWTPPPALAEAIAVLPLPEEYAGVSSTEVRRRIQAGEPWRHMVPEGIAGIVARLYS
jgi:nicotinate-nucleotide adenylyltransferase